MNRINSSLDTPSYDARDQNGEVRDIGAMPGQRSLVMQIVSIARRRRWVLIVSVAAALVLGLLVTLLMAPQYTASATIEIKRESSGGGFVDVQGAEQKVGIADQEFYETQYGLLRASSLAERVATNLKLESNAQFFKSFGVRNSDQWFGPNGLTPAAPSRADRIEIAGGILLRHLIVKPERLSQLVDISFTAPNQLLAKRVVDSWTTSFIQLTLERRYEATSYARQFLEQRLGQLRSRMDESERKLVDYASREGIINLPGATTSTPNGSTTTAERSILADNLTNASQDLGQATADRVRAESRLSGRPGAVSEALENQAITTLRAKRAEVAADYSKMMVQFAPEYPPAKALASQIAQFDRAIHAEEQRVKDTLSGTYASSLGRERLLQKRVDALKSDILNYRRRSVQYNILQRDVDTNRQLYDALLQRFKEIGVVGGVGVNNVSVIDQAQLPKLPSSPKILLNLALAIIVGLLLGGGAALLLEQLDQGISDPSDVEGLLGIPLLGTIPRIAEGEPVDSLADNKSAMSEAYLSLRTNLSFTTDHGIPRSLAVTSSRPAEGKTTTSYALARSLARGRKRVLLIDADMRSPSIHQLFGFENTHGLSNYLAGGDDLDRLVSKTSIENLLVMNAGPQPPSAAELLSGPRVERLLEEALALFDHIVIDAPPVMGLADAPLLSNWVDGTVFVLEAHRTHRNMAETAIQRLITANARILGIVFVKFNAARAYYGYGYDHSYGYGYGDQAKPDNRIELD